MNEIKAAQRAGAIEYLGHVDDVQQALADCSVYVLPSWHEGTPRSVLEAMATGRAIITTDTRGCRETVDEGANGLLVPLRDPASLAAGMIALAGDPERRASMGVESRQLAVSRFDAREVASVIQGALSL